MVREAVVSFRVVSCNVRGVNIRLPRYRRNKGGAADFSPTEYDVTSWLRYVSDRMSNRFPMSEKSIADEVSFQQSLCYDVKYCFLARV